MRKISGWALAAVISAVPAAPAWSWGEMGHMTVGKVADIILQQQDPATSQRIKKLLKGKSLSEAALWADCAKGPGSCSLHLSNAEKTEQKKYAKDNPDHHDFHYTDVPFQENQYRPDTAGTTDHDVVQVITFAVQMLREPSSEPGPVKHLNERKAVWLLAHFVGDIHQPLHVGAVYFDKQCRQIVDPNTTGTPDNGFGIGTTVGPTTGGNDLELSGESENLHHYWDDDTVAAAMRAANKNSVEEFAQFLVDNPPANWATDGEAETWAAKWATEILPITKQALTRVDYAGGKRGQDKQHHLKCTEQVTRQAGYDEWAAGVARDQLAKAGFRLAAMLKAALAD